MKGEDDRLVRGEQRVEIVVREPMRMLTRWLQLHKIHDVYDTHLQIRRMSAEEFHGSESLQRRDVAATNHHDIRFLATIIAGPLPDSQSGGAVLDRLVHRQPLRGRLLAGDNDIDVVSAA